MGVLLTFDAQFYIFTQHSAILIVNIIKVKEQIYRDYLRNMKKQTILILAVIMALTFVGLLYMQFMYIHNMVKMREDQFSESVKRGLYTVSETLEQDETRFFLEEDLSMFESMSLPELMGNNGNEKFNKPFETMDIRLERRDPRQKSMRDILRNQYLYQRGLLNEVILNILTQSRNRPLSERADSMRIASYLKTELHNNGVDLPFEFALLTRNDNIYYKTAGFDSKRDSRKDVFVQTLFQNDGGQRLNYLRVYFPDQHDYIYSSIHFMIPTFIFTGVLLITFIFTIVVAFRQKKLTEMKNDFINNMTHEFKTPITNISLAAQMLDDSAVRKSPAMLHHITGVINDETKRLRFQVEKVLQMSMFDRQKSTLRLTDVNANKIVENIVHTFKLKVEKYGGSIRSELEADDAEVNVDEMHFTNIIFNLLDNAVKYRREETPLSLTVKTWNPDEEHLRISVEDNGIGIKKDDLKKIFDKFFRVSTGNRHDVKGFGLGLAYVRKMTGELGGSITVESELNIGTKFIITLPLTKN